MRAPQSTQPADVDNLPEGLGGPEAGYSLDSFLDGDIDYSSVGAGGGDAVPLDLATETASTPAESTVAERAPAIDPNLVRWTYHTVKRGDNLYAIAQRYQTDLSTLLAVNNIKSSRTLTPDMKLRIPDRKGRLHVVERNDTMEDIALTYQVSIAQITKANGITNPNMIRAGQELFLPGAKPPKPSVAKQSVAVARTKWVTPAPGRVSSQYGMRQHPISGRYTMHKGVDIACGQGGRIQAARAGTVTYAGRLGGYGLLVVVEHPGGYETRYAHCSEITVRRGEKVAQGERIAKAGATGYAKGPHLHFEVHRNGKAVDPVAYLR